MPVIRLRDALGREIVLDRPPVRVVSLVPSETESVVELAGRARVVGCTSYCETLAGSGVAVVGGTKSFDVAAVRALAPDLVLANQEENGKRDVERLIAAGLSVHVSFPRTVAESMAYLRSLVLLLGLGDAGRARVAALEEKIEEKIERAAPSRRLFVPIWREPWMTFDARTYASDLLAHAGGVNVFADRARRFPLAADLGEREATDAGERDTRYPRTTQEEIASRAPELVLLPDEPYAFGPEHAAEIAAWNLGARIEHVNGKDLFWYGVRTAEALTRLRTLLG